MLLLFFFAIGLIVFGVWMIARPLAFAASIVRFSEQVWFHRFEIISRLLLGVSFVCVAAFSTYPLWLMGLGLLLIVASLFLMVIGETRHRQFARRSARIGRGFRVIGVIAIALAVLMLYLISTSPFVECGCLPPSTAEPVTLG